MERSQNTLEEELDAIEKALAKAKIEEPVEEVKKDANEAVKAADDNVQVYIIVMFFLFYYKASKKV